MSVLKRADEPWHFADKYDVERVLGRGGMGTVFEARHSRLGHRVAIKVLEEEYRHSELVTRFEREARAAGALSSPHAVKIFDIDETDDGTPFIVMELLQGPDLAQLVERHGPQPIGASVRWVIEACDAIAEAHRLGIIHRDIKPSNLLLCSDTGSIKVLDFGIAKRIAAKEAAITVGIAPLGTPQYMSPEQIRCAKDVDVRSDIWSLGVTLYELVCGRPPFNHQTPPACIAAIVADPVPEPRALRTDLPDELASVLMRALAKDPSDRFQSVEQLVVALAPFADKNVGDNGSCRIIAATRRTVAKEDTLLEAKDLFIDMPPSGPAIEEAIASPTLLDAPRPMTQGKRLRTSLAFVGAAALALATLASTPPRVGSPIDASAKTKGTEVVDVDARIAALSATSSSSNESGPPAPGDAPTEATVEPTLPAKIGPSRPAAATMAAPRPLPKLARTTRAAGSGPANVVGNEAVHGGLSSPGF